MDESLESILDSLPPKPSRSKLEPYREFIRELRRRGRSYQEITHILRDRCGVTAGVHSVYNFVRVRERAEKRLRTRQSNSPRSVEISKSLEPARGVDPQPPSPPRGDAWKNIEKFKHRQSVMAADEKVFVYNEDEPLKLLRGVGPTSPGKSKRNNER